MNNLIVVRYDNSGHSSFAVMTKEEFEIEVQGNFVEHEPCYLSSIEELELFFSSLPPDTDSNIIAMYEDMIELYKSSIIRLEKKEIIIDLVRYDKYWFVKFPSISGCFTGARSLRLLKQNIKQVLQLHLRDIPVDLDKDLTVIPDDFKKEGKLKTIQVLIPVK